MEMLAKHTMANYSLPKLAWLIALLVFLLVFWMLMQAEVQKASIQFFKPEFFSAETRAPLSSMYYLVNTEGCRIQTMDAFDGSILQYLVNKSNIDETDSGEKGIHCAPGGLPPLINSNLTHIFIEPSAVMLHNLTELHCCYQPFWRKIFDNISTTNVGQIDNEFETADECTKFETSVRVHEHEFVKVVCTADNSSNIIYRDFHSFIPISKKKKTEDTDKRNKLSVIVLGVDAVSRLNLIRQMPRTVDYIKNELEGIEMFGYNKVADNTFPNLVPVLTGLSVKELGQVCWPKSDTYFDDCPFLWKDFSDAGYTTCFAEDASWMGIFNYVKKGFFKQPTDYYWGMYNRRVENEIGWDKRLNANLCTGYRMTISTLLEYAKKFTLTMSGELSFSLIWGSSLSHDYLNLPMYGDNLHLTFVKELHKVGALANSVLVLMSDHGIRWGGIRTTYQGYMEERLPFLYFVFPRWFKKKYATAISYLRRNRKRLTTPFDLHETLGDFMDLSRLQTKSIKERIERGETEGEAMSLFLPVPTNRTCSSAKIPSNWCTCHTTTDISVNDTVVVHAAKHLVKHINSLFSHEKECLPLTLSRIVSARIDQTKPDDEHIAWDRDYLITLETLPGKGLFEATIRHGLTGKFKTMGTVSRTNTYGNQSACTKNYRLRLYCYCQHQTGR